MSEVPTSSSKNSGRAPTPSESEAPTPEETKVEGTEPEAIATEPAAEPAVEGGGLKDESAQTAPGNEDEPAAPEQSGGEVPQAPPAAPEETPPKDEAVPNPEPKPIDDLKAEDINSGSLDQADPTDLPGRAMFSPTNSKDRRVLQGPFGAGSTHLLSGRS